VRKASRERRSIQVGFVFCVCGREHESGVEGGLRSEVASGREDSSLWEGELVCLERKIGWERKVSPDKECLERGMVGMARTDGQEEKLREERLFR